MRTSAGRSTASPAAWGSRSSSVVSASARAWRPSSAKAASWGSSAAAATGSATAPSRWWARKRSSASSESIASASATARPDGSGRGGGPPRADSSRPASTWSPVSARRVRALTRAAGSGSPGRGHVGADGHRLGQEDPLLQLPADLGVQRRALDDARRAQQGVGPVGRGASISGPGLAGVRGGSISARNVPSSALRAFTTAWALATCDSAGTVVASALRRSRSSANRRALISEPRLGGRPPGRMAASNSSGNGGTGAYQSCWGGRPTTAVSHQSSRMASGGSTGRSSAATWLSRTSSGPRARSGRPCVEAPHHEVVEEPGGGAQVCGVGRNASDRAAR